jgi:aminoglycoside phosphotransferase family enzyme/predicted kinase
MENIDLFKNLKDPSTYGSNVNSVNVLQTHISYVALTGKFAYKIKKPVNFGFLNFSTLKKRKFFCEEEIRLNRRLCPEIYLDVVPITTRNDHLEINGNGKTVDYAVKMKEFPQENIMTNLLKKNKLDEETFEEIAEILVKFYKSDKNTNEISQYGTAELFKKNTDENFEQTESLIGITIDKEVFDFIKTSTNLFLEKNKDLFEKRIKNGFIHDCHGDLHTGNIVILDGKICIFDCIEFNKRFRFSDVASDIGFLAMDLDFLGYPYYSSYLIEQYVEKSKDTGIFDVLNFYKCYRAYVRGKVAGFKLNDSNIKESEKQEIIKNATKYFDLAKYYASLFSFKLKQEKPVLFITSGLTGTGKTTVARKIAVDYSAYVVDTDSVRKEIQGIDKFEKHHDEYNTGLYSPEKMAYTYERVFEKAGKLLKNKRNVVLDATFKTKELRDKAKALAKKTNVFFLVLHSVCPEEVVKKYLDERVKKKSVSDGRWEIYVKQKDSFEPPDDEHKVEIDVSNISYNYQINVFREILNKINED